MKPRFTLSLPQLGLVAVTAKPAAVASTIYDWAGEDAFATSLEAEIEVLAS